ncbi:MAG TPA: dihydroorotase [Oligoflexia bacterium]|nr:dihydroorotase [Oligoflexia bacterium]
MTDRNFLLKNVNIINPAGTFSGTGELLVENGRIRAMDRPGKISKPSGFEEIDGKGAACVPGLVDIHVHFREPGFEYKETIATGSVAAAAGGFTSVACMANTNPVNDNPFVTQFIRAQAREHAVVNVYPIGALSVGLKGERLAEIGKMRDAGIVAVSDDGMPVMNSYLMRKALDYCKTFDLPIISHAEDANLVGQGVMHEGFHSCCLGLRGIPAESEEIMVARDIALARLTGGRVHFAHLSTRYALEHVRRAKSEGLKITCEVTPHHFTFRDEDVSSYDSHFKMAPPLRTEADILALHQALADGTIDCIATDHAPHAPRDKNVLFEFAANGVVGLETAWSAGLNLVENGTVSLERLVELLAVMPAKVIGVDGGILKENGKADFFLTDLSAVYTLTVDELRSKSKNSPFIGRTLKGKVVSTFVAGKLV